VGLYNRGVIDTGEGDDIITGTNVDRADGNSYPVRTALSNEGEFYTGDGNDTLTGISTVENGYGFGNVNTIDTGDGKDIIIGTGKRFGILNAGTINTGNGADSLISNGKLWNTGEVFLGEGNDSIIADGGFESGSTGIMFLGEGEDYIKGFGSGDFNGGNGNDILELTSGIYTFWTSPTGEIFAKDGIIMNTVGFEKLIAGSTSYDFTSLSDSQTIIVV
jgi:hypothetical protein